MCQQSVSNNLTDKVISLNLYSVTALRCLNIWLCIGDVYCLRGEEELFENVILKFDCVFIIEMYSGTEDCRLQFTGVWLSIVFDIIIIITGWNSDPVTAAQKK